MVVVRMREKLENNRIAFLDGLRGFAIIGVLLFHAYVSAPQYLPFGDQYSYPPLTLGWVGVQLFFLISGFVILMTLEKCSGPVEFATRRWLRLFPAMLIATVLMLAVDRFVGIGPYSQHTLSDVIPGLFFITPSLIHAIAGITLVSLDTPFWSLYVEVAFYFCFGLIYFTLGRRTAIVAIFSLGLLSYFSNAIGEVGGSNFEKIARAMDWLGFTEFEWFASGSLFYRYFITRRISLFYLALLCAVIGALTNGLFRFSFVDRIGLLSAAAIFATVIRFEFAQKIMSNRIVLFFGFVSYPFYLIHNNLLVGMEDAAAKHFPEWLEGAAPLLPAAALIFVSWLIAKYGEPALRNLIRSGTLTKYEPGTV